MSGGFNNMLHFVGVVEDIHDRTNAGRVRVRAFGIHPPRISKDVEDSVPTKDLPWATVLDGTYGVSPIIPAIGDWVFGFFIDGREAQQPMIIGRLPGSYLNLPGGTGEAGEDGYIPPKAIYKYGEPELHPYVGGEDITKGAYLTQSVSNYLVEQALSEETFDEPLIAGPENNFHQRVIQSKDGDNFIVLGSGEDGDSGDYFLISHSSGSVFQIDSNGTVFIKSFGDQYNTTEGVLSTLVKGSSHTNVQEDWSLKVESGSGKVYINGDLDIECENFNVTARSKMNLHAGVKTNISAAGISMLATADDINVGAKKHTKFSTGTSDNGGGFYVQALHGDLHLDSYKANMFSETYHKISCNGTPAVSEQEKPYKDEGHHGIEINTPDIIHLNAGVNLSGKAGDKLSLQGTSLANMTANKVDIVASSGTLNMKSSGVANLDSNATVQLGNGTDETASSTVSGIDSTRGDQATNLDARVSVTEVANVVSPGSLPASKAKRDPVIKRLTSFITGLLD